MAFRKITFIAFLSFFVTLCGYAQTQTWPVQVSGSMLPPHSLDLKVYGIDRKNDLVFNAFLNDPSEQVLSVRLNVSIEQNGQVVYETNPNYGGLPITLKQFEQFRVDGAVLMEYLSNVALSGYNGSGQGSVNIPEGFNQICLQLYGTERNVPVSNKFCLSGNFRLNQPPQIVRPAFNDKIKMPPVQNMIFSWQPMHLGSGNNPGAVEYTFEMVELPQGVMNANDVFASALKVYTTKTTATSLIYTQAEPVLEPNKYYAWRVTAASILYPTSRLFQNDGKSEVSVFVLYDGEKPTDSFNPFDKASPRGCSVYETGYGPVNKADNIPVLPGVNQTVKLGYFNMKLVSVSGNQYQGYSGRGLIEYPMLRSAVEVDFKNIQVNKEGRVYEAESIDAVMDPALALTAAQLRPDAIAANAGGNYAVRLFKSITNAKKVARLSEGSGKPASLPLAIENSEFAQGMVCVTGIKFTPSNAYLTLIGLENTTNRPAKTIRESDLSVSAATAIPATPYGVKNGAYLVPVSSGASVNDVRITATIVKSLSMDNDSRILCDCNGIRKKQTKEDLYLSGDVIVQKSGSAVKLPLKDSKQAVDNYSGAVDKLPEFSIVGAEDYTFTSGGGALNLDNTKTLSGIPAAMSGKISPAVQKLWLKNNTVTLPSRYGIDDVKNPELKGDLIVGTEGIEYGLFSAENIVALDKGKIEKWQYSVDEMRMYYEAGAMSRPSISGKVLLPVSSHQFDYTGTYQSAGNGNPVVRVDKLPGQLPIEMWKGTMDLAPVSDMTLAIKNISEERTLYPTASLSGNFAMKLDNLKNSVKGNIAQTIEDVKKVFDLKSDDIDFGVSGINIQDWAFDPYTSKDNKYIPANLDVSDARFHIAGKSYRITSGEIIYKSDDKEKLGLAFTTVAGNNRISFTIWGVEKNGKFVFDGIEENSFQLKCDCGTGKSIGMLDYDKIYDGIIRDRYMPHLSTPKQYGGTSAVTGEMSAADAMMYNTWKQYLQDNTMDGFVLKDANTLYWPLLDRDFEVTSNQSQIRSVKDIRLNESDFKKLGFKSDVWVPRYYNLVTGDLIIDLSANEGSRTTLKFKLLPGEQQSETFRSTFKFESGALPVSGSAIQIADVRLNRTSSGNIAMREGVMWTDRGFSSKYKSHAMLDCTKGLGNIELYGILLPIENLDKNSKKIMNATNDGKYFESGIPMRATIENVSGRTFENYIATCLNFVPGKEDEEWKFILKDYPHIVFKPGERYEIYYDHHAHKDVAGFDAVSLGFASDGKSFQGLVFKKFAAEVSGFDMGNNKPLEVMLTDGVFVEGNWEKQGFYLSKVVTNVVDEKAGANLSGWKYKIDTLSFEIEGSVLTKNVSVSGAMQIPIFKDKPINYEKRKFDRGWANFSGEILSDNGELSSTLGFQDLKNKLYQSVLLPGMAMKLNESSVVTLDYNQKTKKWIPNGKFSGLCDFYMNHNVSLSLNTIIPPGLDVASDPISFENVELSAESFDGSMKFKLDQNQVAYLSLGDWGDVESEDLTTDQYKEVQDFLERLGGSGNEGKSAGVSKAMPGDKGSKAESESTFMGFDLVSTFLGPKQCGGEIIMGLKLAIGLMGSTKETTDEGTETKTQSIKAEGVLGLIYSPTKESQDTWQFSSIRLECLVVEGNIGPLGFKGGLNILRDDEEYGSGLKGLLSGEIEKVGGMNLVGQFGKKKDADDEYYYGFLDLEVFSEQGIPLPPPTPVNPPVIDLFGAGGGIHINMRTKKAIDDIKMPSKADMAKKEADSKAAKERGDRIDNEKKNGNDNYCKNFCEGVGGDLLQPGVGLNQNYTPNKGTFGGKFFLIFGPYTPVKPPYTIVADAGIRMEIDYNSKTNEIALGEMAIEARGYLMPESIRERREENAGDAYASVTLNWREKCIDGEVSFRSKFELPGLGTTIFSMPDKYDSTDFGTRAYYNTGWLRFGFDTINPYAELKLGGPGTGVLKPISGTFLTRILPLTHTTIKAYAQIGANIDPPAALNVMIPELDRAMTEKIKKEREDALKAERPEKADTDNMSSKGIAFGLTMAQDINANFLLLHARLLIKLGFDVNLRDLSAIQCSNSDNKGDIGLKGWYAQGSAFAYAKGNIDMGFRLFGADLTAEVFNASVCLAMQVKGPNPTYFRGMIVGQYNVLDGMFSGDFQYKVVIGEECEVTTPPDPLADITIYADASVANGQTQVDRYADITLKTNIPLRKDYTLTQQDTKGNASHAVIFMADIKKIKVLTKGKEVNCNYTLKPGAKSLDITFDQTLEPMTEYTIEYEFGWKVKEGEGTTAKYTDRDKPETGTIKFTTGARPTTMTAGMIEYSAPGDRQRYWHKGYADTEIKFKLKALEDAVTLFPAECKDCAPVPGTSGAIKFKYTARLTEFNDNGAVSATRDFAITGYPGKGEHAKIQDQKMYSVGGKYNITYLEERSVPVSKVSFPDLKNYDLKKGKLYELSIVRELDLTLPASSDANYKKVRKIVDDNMLTLKSYYFGTSLYESLNDKLANLEVRHAKSLVKMRDFSHPSDVYDSQRASVISQLGESKFHSVRDDYYCFKISNRKGNEGFDQYDILRLRRNLKLEYAQDYIPELRITQLHKNRGLHPDLAKYLNGGSIAGKDYLKKVLFDHTKAEQMGMLEYGGGSRISDGSKWHYRISGSGEAGRNLLRDQEISAKKMSNPEKVYRSKLDPNTNNPVFNEESEYDFLLQDLRSRIVINQLYWLSRLSSGVKCYNATFKNALVCIYNGDYNIEGKGEFMIDGRRDLSFISTAPAGLSLKTKTMEKAYIATEPGYRLSYHGASSISFPSGTWGEMIESKRDKGTSMTVLKSFQPVRSLASGEKIPVANINELSTDEWYTMTYHGNTLKVKHFDTDVQFDIWGLDIPQNPTNTAQYMIYSPAYGLLGTRKFLFIEDYTVSKRYNWNFVNSGSQISILNEENIKEDDYATRKKWTMFPLMLPYYDHKNLFISLHKPPDYSDNDITLSEVSYFYFSPEKIYNIYQDGELLKDGNGCSDWRIVRDGRFYRLISARGTYLRGHRYDPIGLGDYRIAKSEEKTTFPARGTDDYYKFLWNITKTGNNTGEFYIQNVYYIRHFLKGMQYYHHDRKESEMSEEKRVKLLIKEKL